MSDEPLFQSFARRRAGAVTSGNLIVWCDRLASVVEVEHRVNKYRYRDGVYLTVDIPDIGRRRLHYYADEEVPCVEALT